MREMLINEILSKGLREELSILVVSMLVYVSYSAITTAAAAKEEYDKQMSERILRKLLA